MTRLEKMLNELAILRKAIQDALDANDTATAEAKMAEAKDLKKRIDMQKEIDAAEEKAMKENDDRTEEQKAQTAENASTIRAIIKKFTGKPMTESEKALLLPTAQTPAGTNGEAYILPQDIRTKIVEKIRDFRSFRDVIGTITTTALTGSQTVDSLANIAGLVNFDDGTAIATSEDPQFTRVTWALKNYGAVIEMSNTLLAMTDAGLENYIIGYFAKKAVITENTLAIAALKSGKTIKTLSDWAALKSSINKDLDPASLYGTVIVTNQDGWDVLDSATDETGRPVLQPDPTSPTQKRFMGYPVVAFSNALLPSSNATATKDGYAPIFYGNLEEGAKFVEANAINFAFSSEAGFLKNTTYARVIEQLDCVQWDGADACYMAGQFKVADKTGT